MVREKGDVHVRYGSSRASTLVIFGEPRDATLRSVLTPEELGFRVDPESRRLPENRVHPMVPVAGV